jgi:N-sulfoglucosamine sulfohydrolase
MQSLEKLFLIFILPLLAATTIAADRPNILWLTVEDMSPNLGCYGDANARTPNIDALAKRSVRYTHAFANAPVCSPARNCLITGMYPTSLGTQRLRSQFPIPKEVRGFSAYLRETGYFCTNNVKTDYNIRDEAAFIKDAWNDSSATAHWRARKADQPFFAVFNSMTTHQTRTGVWPHEQFEKEVASKLKPEERHDPAKLTLPPYYPDTPLARKAWARYHDCITAMDKEIGERLAELESSGVAQNTIVFFFSDHGMGMPRGKRTLQDSGMQVPLLIYFPEKYKHLAPAKPGESTGRLVSFVDFAPTVLSVLGLKTPDHMQGSAFIGAAAGKPREYVFGARDRVDEAFDVARSVRDSRWLYIRNYMPHLPWMQPERFSDNSDFRREFKHLAAQGKLNAPQLTFGAPGRAQEELYDTQADPHNLKNLADAPEHRAQLEKLRAALREWIMTSRDAGFVTEPDMWARIGTSSTPFEIAVDPARYPLNELLAAAELSGRADCEEELSRLLKATTDAGVRYWAASALFATGARGEKTARKALQDNAAVVRIEAAAALMKLSDAHDALAVLKNELESEQPEVALHAARALELLGNKSRPVQAAMEKALKHAQQNEPHSEIFMFIRFSLEAALENLQRAASY